MSPVVIAATMWLMVSLAFILNALHAPPWLIRIPLGVLAAEFVATIAWGYSSAESGPAYTAVVYMLPGAAVAVALCTIAYGLRRHRRAES
jgi:hypothetical protein